ncbi:MAG: radical SAM protein [Propionibacteriaceae bacterium]|jgi:23S rRNA (adenine2503-C2)-methyltransferase|nr:radical SAM protein [Propionibacteriaceae bacterium]
MSRGLTPAEERELAELDAHAEAGRALPLVLEAPRRGRRPLHWLDLDAAAQLRAVADLGLPSFRASQLNRHLLVRNAFDPQDWTDIPKADRSLLAEALLPGLLSKVRELRTDSGTTVKTLWRLGDGALVESVLMRYGVPGIRSSGSGRMRTTVCVSSQAGCGMACPFCATGQGGLRRNLTTAEIIAQVIRAGRQSLLAPTDPVPSPAQTDSDESSPELPLPGGSRKLSNVVFMGMGEPLANYSAVLAAIRRIVAPAPDGSGVSARGVTVSTVGLVPAIDKLASAGLPLTLALSLHAPDDELRDELCPLNTRYPVAEVLSAGYRYFQATSRRVSIEYALIKAVNDQPWRAELLADKLRRSGDYRWTHVNLIPLNPTPGSKWTASSKAAQADFAARLERRGLQVTVRDTRGREISGACGQLAAQD